MNIAEMKSTDVEGDAITGGYLVELDVNFDEVNKFYSATRNLPYMFKEPDEDVLQPVRGPLIDEVSHGGRRGDRVDRRNLAERIRNVRGSVVAVHGFHFSYHSL